MSSFLPAPAGWREAADNAAGDKLVWTMRDSGIVAARRSAGKLSPAALTPDQPHFAPAPVRRHKPGISPT